MCAYYRPFSGVVAALVVLAAAMPAARAEILPTISRRELVIRSSHTLLAEPLEDHAAVATDRKAWTNAPSAYRVLEVLKSEGKRITAGDLVAIDGTDSYRLGNMLSDPRKPPQIPQLEKTLLFLVEVKATAREGIRWRVMASGIRGRSKTGELLVPRQQMNPGPYYLSPEWSESDESWEEFVKHVRADIPLIADVHALREIEPAAARNQAVFNWIHEHRDEFDGGLSIFRPSKTKPGWGSLELTVFEWIVDSGIPEDAWRALVLRQEISGAVGRRAGYAIGRAALSFATPQGRELLFGIAINDTETDSRRVLALNCLSSSCWPGGLKRLAPKLQSLSRQEQARFLGHLKPLLKSENEYIRYAVVHTVFRVSRSTDAVYSHLNSLSAVPDLVDAYEAEPPGRVRNELAETLFVMQPETYARISGNPANHLILLRSAIVNQNYGRENISVYISAKGSVSIGADELPVTLQRIDPTGNVVENQTMIGVRQRYSPLNVPSSELAEGRWKITVHSDKVDHEFRFKWNSEPALFDLKRETQNSNEK